MKTFKQHVALQEKDSIEESVTRTGDANDLTLRISRFRNQIIAMKYLRTENHDQLMEKLFRKLDLLAEQNNALGSLTSYLFLK
jgi:hypothetical protein